MRIAHDTKLTNRPDPSRDEPETTPGCSIESPPSAAIALPWLEKSVPTGIAGVPTHAIGTIQERRSYTRARISLPVRLKRIAGQRAYKSQPLWTANISSSGVLFLCPFPIDAGTPIDMEVLIVDRPFSWGSVRMTTEAHLVRSEPSARRGWHALAATFDDISFYREEPLPSHVENA